MCGILGGCVRDGLPPASAIEAALRTLRHRGPDDEGYVFLDSQTGHAEARGGVDTPAALALPELSKAGVPRGADMFLASRRLAIQDLSPAGHQPMRSADGRLWLAFNGEIYNFRELRHELEDQGLTFSTGSDTEVLLAAFATWGDETLDRCNGMWGLALWDAAERRLLLARDRFGVKPLYYTWSAGQLLFASEIKALLAWPGIRAEPNERVLDDYLAFGLVDQTNETFFAGVQQLAPGHTLELRLPDGIPTVRRWYELRLTAPAPIDETAERFAALFEDACDHRLISDVPVGTCLSGGLDSSAIVCVVDRLLGEGHRAGSADRQLTFSARYDDRRHDEGTFIDAVVAATAVEPHEARPTAEGLALEIDQLVRQQDEPFWSTSIYAQWLVFRSARENGVVVTLDGQGGDEVAGGYTHYFGPRLASLLRAARPIAFVQEAAALARRHPSQRAQLPIRIAAGLAPWRLREQLARRTRRPTWVRGTGEAEPRDVYGVPNDPLSAQIHRDLTLGLRPLLRVADRNSMAHSVESRLPFLDYRLVEFGYSARPETKIRDGVTKTMLREGLRDVLPREGRDRHDKIGFSTPEDTWFRGALLLLARDVLSSPSFQDRPWFDAARVRETLEAHVGGANRALELWRALNTELWARQHLD